MCQQCLMFSAHKKKFFFITSTLCHLVQWNGSTCQCMSLNEVEKDVGIPQVPRQKKNISLNAWQKLLKLIEN